MFLIMSFILFSPILIWMFLIHTTVTEDHLFYNIVDYTILSLLMQEVFNCFLYFPHLSDPRYLTGWLYLQEADSVRQSFLRLSDGI